MGLLDQGAISSAIAGGAWAHQDNELVRVVRCDDFDAALEFVNAVGAIASRVGHHPDVDIRWNVVTLRLSTHSLGGVTNADLALAKELDVVC
ncbi:MAG TPA: 4a-hydroxytetrahydrobiopterin dehydratase [Acidimicrobiales bacterium]|nr:4a-hydroxytetrahydrobiopterin dehydratase [Acidimicrobiales bacterium]